MGEQRDLYEEITGLINMHQEGPYWDFKRQWYGKEKDADMLLDIICMANNLKNHDAYIIIGVDEEANYSICDVQADPNRRNTQNLTNFLSDKHFAGDFRPTVTVESLSYGDGMIDVIVVHNSLDVPFYLKEPYASKTNKDKKVEAGNIYVRLQDSNTPRNAVADFHQVEYLWKKRFGMLLSPKEKVMLYLRHPEDWESVPSYNDKRYYKYAPEYTIEQDYESEDDREEFEYYTINQCNPRPHWTSIRIYYHQTIIDVLGGVILDGGHYSTSTPTLGGITLPGSYRWSITYSYMVKGTIDHLVHKFYFDADRNEAAQIAHDCFEECILIFEDETERLQFNDYVREHWAAKDDLGDDIYIPQRHEVPSEYRAVLEERYKNAMILSEMLRQYRHE